MKKLLTLKLGKIKQQFVTLSKFSIDLYYEPNLYLNTMWNAGQLYRGYAGLMAIFYGLRLDIMISNWRWGDSRT